MTDKFYVCSKDLGPGPEPFGELWIEPDGRYYFKYTTTRKGYLLDGLPDLCKVYGPDEVDKYIFKYFVQPVRTQFHKAICRQVGLPEETEDSWLIFNRHYDQTGIVRATGQPLGTGRETMYFYKELPRRVYRYGGKD